MRLGSLGCMLTCCNYYLSERLDWQHWEHDLPPVMMQEPHDWTVHVVAHSMDMNSFELIVVMVD